MTNLETTIYRKIMIGRKTYVLGIHPNDPEPILSIRELGRRVPYAVPVSTVRVHAALAFGRAESAAKREARKSGIRWKTAKRKFYANILPPDRRRVRSKEGDDEKQQ